MKKLSQKEILGEGFGSLVKSLARGAAGIAKGTAKMISPTAAKVAKGAADKVGAAIGNVLSSPTSAIKEYFNRPEIKSKYDKLKIGKETKLNNYRRQIELEFRDVRKNEQIKTTAEAYRTDEGGTSPETWSFEKIKTTDGKSIGPDGEKGGKKGGKPADPLVSTPAPVEKLQPKDDSDTKRAFNLTKRLAVSSGAKQAEIGAVEPLNRDEMEGFDKEFLAKFKQKVKVQKDGRVSMDGFRFSKKQVDELFKESRKSQKSLLKHLQSMSR